MGKIWVYSTYGQFTRQHRNFSYFFFCQCTIMPIIKKISFHLPPSFKPPYTNRRVAICSLSHLQPPSRSILSQLIRTASLASLTQFTQLFFLLSPPPAPTSTQSFFCTITSDFPTVSRTYTYDTSTYTYFWELIHTHMYTAATADTHAREYNVFQTRAFARH